MKRIVVLAALLVLPMVLFPPWELVYQRYPTGQNYRLTGISEYAGYHLLWSPPQTEQAYAIAHPHILFGQLALQVAAALLLSIVVAQLPWTKEVNLGRKAS